MRGIFCKILSVPHNNVMDLNNVITALGWLKSPTTNLWLCGCLVYVVTNVQAVSGLHVQKSLKQVLLLDHISWCYLVEFVHWVGLRISHILFRITSCLFSQRNTAPTYSSWKAWVMRLCTQYIIINGTTYSSWTILFEHMHLDIKWISNFVLIDKVPTQLGNVESHSYLYCYPTWHNIIHIHNNVLRDCQYL